MSLDNNSSSLPYAVVLLASEEIDKKTIALSKQLHSAVTRFVLEEDKYYPHLTLYMAQLKTDSLGEVKKVLVTVARQFTAFYLNATQYAQDKEGMIEVQYERPDSLINLQKEVINGITPLR